MAGKQVFVAGVGVGICVEVLFGMALVTLPGNPDKAAWHSIDEAQELADGIKTVGR